MTSPATQARTAALQRFHAMQIPALSTEEERRLIALGKQGDQRARDQIIRANIGLVMVLALRLKLGSVPIEDVIQEGIGGMVEAIERFDLSREVRFGTYAMWWAKARITLYVKRIRSVVRPRSTDVAQQDASLDAVVSEEGDATFGDLLADEAELPDVQHAQADHDHRVRQALWRVRGRLGPLGWDVVELRLCAGEDGATLEELGEKHGVSRERVRQVELKVRDLLGRYLGAEGFGPDEARDPLVVQRIASGRPVHRLAPPVEVSPPGTRTVGWRDPGAEDIAAHSDELLIERLRAGGWQADAVHPQRQLPPPTVAWLPPEVIAASSDRALLAGLAAYEPPAPLAPANEEDGMACPECKSKTCHKRDCSRRPGGPNGRKLTEAEEIVRDVRRAGPAPALKTAKPDSSKPLAEMTVDELIAARSAASARYEEARNAAVARIAEIDLELRRRQEEIAKALEQVQARASA